MKKRLKLFTYVLVLIMLAACQKNHEVDLSPDLNVANDVVTAECSYRYTFNMVIKAQTDSAIQQNHSGWIDSAWVVYNTSLNEYLFQYSWKVCPDSVVRSGRFRADFNSSILNPGSVTQIFFENYFDGNDSISGVDSIVNKGFGAGNTIIFTNYIKNGLILKGLDHNSRITWSSETQFVTNAISFTQPGDIIFLMSGNCSGISSKGLVFSAEFNSLTDPLSCPWILDGQISLTIPDAGYTTGTVDFIPNDGCSNRLKYTFEGNIFYLWKNAEFLKN
jgi:hypothetical protein